MSRYLMDESYYVSHGGMIPVKWTAPEVYVAISHYNNKNYIVLAAARMDVIRSRGIN